MKIRIPILIIILLLLISKETLFTCPPAIFINQNEVSPEEDGVAQYIFDYIDEDSKIMYYTDKNNKTTKISYLSDYKCSLSWIDIINDINNYDIEQLKGYDYVCFSYYFDLDRINSIFAKYANSNEIYNEVLYKIVWDGKIPTLIMMC